MKVKKSLTMKAEDFPFLKRPIKMKVRYENNFWIAEHPELCLTLYADSYADLKKNFELEMAFLIKNVLQMPNTKLTPRMIKVKQKLRQYVNPNFYKKERIKN